MDNELRLVELPPFSGRRGRRRVLLRDLLRGYAPRTAPPPGAAGDPVIDFGLIGPVVEHLAWWVSAYWQDPRPVDLTHLAAQVLELGPLCHLWAILQSRRAFNRLRRELVRDGLLTARRRWTDEGWAWERVEADDALPCPDFWLRRTGGEAFGLVLPARDEWELARSIFRAAAAEGFWVRPELVRTETGWTVRWGLAWPDVGSWVRARLAERIEAALGHPCRRCGRPAPSRAKYCSESCRRLAYRERTGR